MKFSLAIWNSGESLILQMFNQKGLWDLSLLSSELRQEVLIKTVFINLADLISGDAIRDDFDDTSYI